MRPIERSTPRIDRPTHLINRSTPRVDRFPRIVERSMPFICPSMPWFGKGEGKGDVTVHELADYIFRKLYGF